MGKPMKRLDGPQKASGRAKYTSDLKMKDMLYAAYLTCPHAHARVTSIDTGAAEKMNGVKAVHVIAEAGKELQWHGQEVAAVAATTEEVAREAVRKIKVDYEVLPHFVNEADLGKAGVPRQGRRRESHRRSRQGHAGCRGRLRRHLRHPGRSPTPAWNPTAA